MTVHETIIREALQGIGLGPDGIDAAFDGSEIYGSSGLLNSLELVQFVTALGERTRIDPTEFLMPGEGSINTVLSCVSALRGFLETRLGLAEGV